MAVGGGVAAGTDLDPHGGRVDTGVADATAPYLDLVGQLAPSPRRTPACPATGTAEVTDDAITLTGDGVSNPQVFTVDGAALARSRLGRSLQLLGVPQDAGVIVNLTGPAVALDIDTLLSPDGLPVDPLTDPYFAEPGHPPALERPVRHDGRHRRPGPAARLAAGPDRPEHHDALGRRHQRPDPGGRRPGAHGRGRAARLPVPPRPGARLHRGPGAPHHADPRRRARRPGQGRRPGPVLRGPTSSAPWAATTSPRPTTPGSCARERTPGCCPTRSRPVPSCMVTERLDAPPAPFRTGPSPWSSPTWWSWRSARTSASRSPTG